MERFLANATRLEMSFEATVPFRRLSKQDFCPSAEPARPLVDNLSGAPLRSAARRHDSYSGATLHDAISFQTDLHIDLSEFREHRFDPSREFEPDNLVSPQAERRSFPQTEFPASVSTFSSSQSTESMTAGRCFSSGSV
jgi:hypothetical protein